MASPRAETMASPLKRRGWLFGAFAIAFFAIGAMHWPLAYSDVQLPNSIIGPGLALVVFAGAMARILGRASFWIAVLVVGSAAPAAIAARVAVDTASDPTSHNLWPLELFLGGFVGYLCAAVGALTAGVWARVTQKR